MIGGTIISPETSFAVMNAMRGETTKPEQKLENTQEQKKIEDAAKDFESVFIAEMLKPMFENTTPSSPFNGGKGEEIFQGMMLQEYGKMLADHGGIGLTTQIKEQMIKMQQQAHSTVK